MASRLDTGKDQLRDYTLYSSTCTALSLHRLKRHLFEIVKHKYHKNS